MIAIVGGPVEPNLDGKKEQSSLHFLAPQVDDK